MRQRPRMPLPCRLMSFLLYLLALFCLTPSSYAQDVTSPSTTSTYPSNESPSHKINCFRRQELSGAEALEQLQAIDNERAAFIRTYYGKEYYPHPQPLMVNRAIGEDTAVDSAPDAAAQYTARARDSVYAFVRKALTRLLPYNSLSLSKPVE